MAVAGPMGGDEDIARRSMRSGRERHGNEREGEKLATGSHRVGER